jgi:predicted ATPase
MARIDDLPAPYIASVELLRERIPNAQQYPYSIPSLRNLHKLEITTPVTFFVGENGSGKSTLLEAIALVEGFNPEGGSKNFSFSTRASHSELCQCMRLSRNPRRLKDFDGYFFRAESFFNVATELDVNLSYFLSSYGGKSLHEQSHGEAFFSLVCNRFKGNGLYLMDEPESALSPSRQLSFLAIMQKLVLSGSQFIIATHSPVILGFPGAQIYEFSTKSIKQVAYEDTEQYKVTRAFLTRTKKMLDQLFEEV